MKTLDEHIIHTGRRVFIAYIMLEGVNDSKEHAEAVVSLLKNRGSWEHLYHIDLIPYNSTDKTTFKFQSSSAIKQFCSTLKKLVLVQLLEHNLVLKLVSSRTVVL